MTTPDCNCVGGHDPGCPAHAADVHVIAIWPGDIPVERTGVFARVASSVNAPNLCPRCGAYWQCDCKRSGNGYSDLEAFLRDAQTETDPQAGTLGIPLTLEDVEAALREVKRQGY